MFFGGDLAVQLVLFALLFRQQRVAPFFEMGKTAVDAACLAAVEPDRDVRQLREEAAVVADDDERRAALVIISHDRRFLSTLSRVTVWLDRGETRRIDRGFAHFEEWRDALLAEEEREQYKLDRKIVAEEHWIRYGVTARRKRNMRRVGELQALRERRRSLRAATGAAAITASSALPSGMLVIEADRISKSYGERPIVSNFSIRIQRGDRIGIVGPNGSGKTTLINMLTGALAPDRTCSPTMPAPCC